MESIYIKNASRLSTQLVNEKQKSPFLQLLFILLLLQQAFLSSNFAWSQAISYLDDIISACLLAVFIWRSIQGFRLYKKEKTIVLMTAAIFFLGFLSNLLFHLQPVPYALLDAFTCFKFLFSYLGIRALYSGKISPSFIDTNFSGTARIFAVLLFLLTVHDSFFSPFFPVSEYRFSTYSIKLFYPHPQYLACACIILMCILVSTLEQHKSDIFFLIMLSVVIFRTFRMKSIGFAAVFFLLLIFVYVFHIRSQLLLLLPLLLCGLSIGWSQIQLYFFNSEVARAILTTDSIKIANRYFPLGSGFATFGSNMANIHYSPLYQMLGYNGTYGMSEKSINYLSDTFWPILIAQFGYIGLLCFLGIVIAFFQICSRFKNINLCSFVAQLAILIYMMISSTSESSFFNPFATLYFIIFGLLVSQNLPANWKETLEGPKIQKSKYIK